MLKIDIWPEAEVFLETLSDKHKKQIVAKLFLLADVPFSIQSKQLTGFAPFLDAFLPVIFVSFTSLTAIY